MFYHTLTPIAAIACLLSRLKTKSGEDLGGRKTCVGLGEDQRQACGQVHGRELFAPSGAQSSAATEEKRNIGAQLPGERLQPLGRKMELPGMIGNGQGRRRVARTAAEPRLGRNPFMKQDVARCLATRFCRQQTQGLGDKVLLGVAQQGWLANFGRTRYLHAKGGRRRSKNERVAQTHGNQ